MAIGRTLIGALILLIALLVGGCMAGERSGGDLRVCTEESFDFDARECGTDERGDPLEASAAVCSTVYAGHKGDRVFGEMTFNGEQVRQGELTLGSEDEVVLIATGALGSHGERLPAGAWTCRLELEDEARTAEFETGGEIKTGHVTELSCLTNRSEEGDCPVGSESEGFNRPESVTCSSIVIGAAGESVTIDVLLDEFVLKTFRLAAMPNNVGTAHAAVSPAVLGMSEETLPTGWYDCRFTVGDLRPWDVRFRVSG